MSADLVVVHEERDAGGDVCRIEVDPRDGRTYLTVVADGHEAPFEISEASRGRIAWALVGPGIHDARVNAGQGDQTDELVKQGTAAVKTASTGLP